MKLKRLNQKGIQEFGRYINVLREVPTEKIPVHILTDDLYTEEFPLDIDIENPGFASRYELGKYLVEKLAGCSQSEIAVDAGLWGWLGLLYFPDLCPANANAERKPSVANNYILSAQHTDFHRHAIRTTYMLVREHGENVRYMLSNPLSKRGELTEQLTGRSYFMSCEGIMEAARMLYADSDRGTWKRGAAAKKPGTVRRFGIVVRQLELTYDLFSLNGAQILELLPGEFNTFRH